MEINKFDKIGGQFIENIDGTFEYGYIIYDDIDFYEMVDIKNIGKHYNGSVLKIANYKDQKIYQVFERREDVLYGAVEYYMGYLYFLQGDFSKNKIRLYKCKEKSVVNIVCEMEMTDMDMYNLRILKGDKIYVISEDEDFKIYYPEKVTFDLIENESVIYIEDNRIYSQEWVEEEKIYNGLKNYNYYENLIIRDFSGKLLSKELGQLKYVNGKWYLS